MTTFGSVVFSFGGQSIYMEAMAEMQRPKDFRYALTFLGITALVVYTAFSLVCYFTYGPKVNPNILRELPRGGWMRETAAVMVAVHIAVSYVLTNQVICRAIHVRVSAGDVDTGSMREKLQWFAITFSALLFSFMIANFLPYFPILMGVTVSVSAVTTTPLSLGVPAFFYLLSTKAHGYEVNTAENTLLYGMLGASVVIFVGLVSGTMQNIRGWVAIGDSFHCPISSHWWP
jgi:hypothetical protein